MAFTYENKGGFYGGVVTDTARGITLREITEMLPDVDRTYKLNWHNQDITFSIEYEYKLSDDHKDENGVPQKTGFTLVYGISAPDDFPETRDKILELLKEALSVHQAMGKPEHLDPTRIAFTPHVFRNKGGPNYAKGAKIKLWRDGKI